MAATKTHTEAVPAFAVPNERIGPHFDKLNPRRKAFVMAYVTQGKRNAKHAYIAAGYNCTTDRSA